MKQQAESGHTEEARCPTCGALVILEYDYDPGQPWVKPWLRDVWRTCSCPMPKHVDEYRN